MSTTPTPTIAEGLADRPDLLAGVSRLISVIEDGRFDPDILDMCRKRIGTILRCPNHSGPIPRRDELTARALVCVDFAEMFVLDHHAITDAQAQEVTRQLSDAEMVAFTTALAVYDGFCRFERTLIPEGD